MPNHSKLTKPENYFILKIFFFPRLTHIHNLSGNRFSSFFFNGFYFYLIFRYET